MLRNLVLISAILAVLSANGQQTILDEYIQIGLDNNLVLKQKQASYKKSIYSLKEANALFYPSLSINARYTWAHGGRMIELPIGDLMNPVYSALHEMTNTAYQVGLADEIFPDTSIANQTIQFMREKEHETKLELIQPLFNSDIIYNKKIKKDLVDIEGANIYTYQHYLVAEIRKAYYTYLKVQEYNILLNETMGLIDENIRVNEKLYENDKVTIDAVYRAKSEKSKLEQMLAETERDEKLSKAYFNLLLNQPFDTEIISDAYETYALSDYEIDNSKDMALSNRGEILTINKYINLSHNSIKMNQFNKMPSIFAIVDYGFQGEEYKFNDDNDFVLASLVFKWDIFSGFQKNAKIQQAKIDQLIIETKKEEIESQISMEVISGYYEIEASKKSIKSAEAEVELLKSVYKIISKKYKEGQVTQLEYIDAQTNLLNAEKKLIIMKYDYLIKKADYERIIASYPINEIESNE